MTEPMEITAATRPLDIFSNWLGEAQSHSGIREATAMAVATIGKDGAVHNRIVLCKGWSEEGFVFYTNYRSRKGLDLEHNSAAGAVFYWDPLARQVRISGSVHKTSRQDSENYWRSRPRDSQLSQYISKQSEEVESRAELERLQREAETQFSGREVPCPPHWGGYILAPKTIEFWLGQPGRLHDRYEFEKSQNHWTFRRLYP